MDYTIVIMAALLLSFDFALQKKYQATEGADLLSGLKFNAIIGLITAIIFFAFSGFKIEFSVFSATLAFFMSLCCTAYTILGFRILKAGNMAVYSIFLMSGGMLLPYLFGVFFLEEKLTYIRILGLIIILLAIIFSNKSKYSFNKSQLLLCIAIFILNGIVSIISKCHQINTTNSTVNCMTFVMYSGIWKFILSSVVLLICKKESSDFSFSSKLSILILPCSAVVSGVSYMFQLIGATNLPATVLYPLVTGGSIIFSAFSGRIFFKEKFSFWQILSILLCFAGTLLFL